MLVLVLAGVHMTLCRCVRMRLCMRTWVCMSLPVYVCGHVRVCAPGEAGA